MNATQTKHDTGAGRPRKLGKGRFVRLTDDQWGLLLRWADELSKQFGIDVQSSDVLRRLIDAEQRRREAVKEFDQVNPQ